MKILKTALFLITLIVFYITLWISPASAILELNGTFTAQRSCPALQSIKKRTNPGNFFCDDDRDENQKVITELWINLQGEIDKNTSILDLLKNSPNARIRICIGEIDPAPVNEA